MKILHFPAYITINEYKAFSRSTSGYGYMTIDIATSIARQGIDVDLLTQSNITKGLKYENVNILTRTWWNILSNIRLSDIWLAFRTIIKDHVALKKTPNNVLYNISRGYFSHILKKNKYDLIHIHGIGHYTLPIITVCEKNNVKYLVTLHGLNSFSHSINATKWERQNEKKFLQKALDENTPVSVISTGIKQTILNHFKIKDSINFKVILNACEVNSKESLVFFNIRENYGIPKTNRIIVCVGNIGNNKNQIQIVRSYSLLPDIIKKSLTLLMLGRDSTNGLVQNKIVWKYTKRRSKRLLSSG
jgi:glycosyltransferase involved in cell wall biosynthesis